MDCKKCGAPLPVNRNRCEHCGVVNDIDLRAVKAPMVHGPHTDRVCPHCDRVMISVDLHIGDGFFIERCEGCGGLFFDPDELEGVFEASVSQVFEADLERMAVLTEESATNYSNVKYVKCPVCREIMNRRNYGARSGVIVDTCKMHGVWLDAGELRRLLHWVKAGGLLHDKAKQQRERKSEERTKRARQAERSIEDRGRMGSLDVDFGDRDTFSAMPSIVRFIFDLLD